MNCKPFNQKTVIDMDVVRENGKYCVYALYNDFSAKLLEKCSTMQEARYICNNYGFIMN